ncbi:MAG: DUF1656 domain-containing protein [Geminicoccaceae bacterium]|nr:DUF1656 domain-containing protein [Geminicoccaceae bacterium]MCB9942347.1 DUF1656 domain-containing protein [Geminicoccaceae bacterium]
MIPREIDINGVYVPPLLLVLLISLAAAWVTARLLNRWRISRYFVMPRLVYLSIIAIYAVLFGTFLIRV